MAIMQISSPVRSQALNSVSFFFHLSAEKPKSAKSSVLKTLSKNLLIQGYKTDCIYSFSLLNDNTFFFFFWFCLICLGLSTARPPYKFL